MLRARGGDVDKAAARALECADAVDRVRLVDLELGRGVDPGGHRGPEQVEEQPDERQVLARHVLSRLPGAT